MRAQFQPISPLKPLRFGQTAPNLPPDSPESQRPDSFQRRQAPSFLPLKPEDAIKLSFNDTMAALKARIGDAKLQSIMQGQPVESPVAKEKDGYWLKQSKIIGVHPRVLGTYLDIVKYALTFPEDAIHLLPVLEAGCNQSLYSPINWSVSREFMSPDLTQRGFDTPEKQLKLTINLLHALGKTVGLDVQLHTDRFSEILFANPSLFEWLKLNPEKTDIVSNADNLHEEVQQVICQYLKNTGNPQGQPVDEGTLARLFTPEASEPERLALLFGTDPETRLRRRVELMHTLRQAGFEPVPVTYVCPYRPVHIEEVSTDADGNRWPEYRIPSTSISDGKHVFGNLTPFKWYGTQNGMLNFSDKRQATWDYFAGNIAQMQQTFGFDFLRADMAHIQKNPAGLKTNPTEDEMAPWAYIKHTVQKRAPYFATLAESFLANDGTGFGDPHQNMEAQKFDVVLGMLHHQAVEPALVGKVIDGNTVGISKNVGFKLCNTMMTADIDDPRFDDLYSHSLAKSVRAFLGLFLNQPSYMGVGYETRDDAQQSDNPTRYTHSYTEDSVKYQSGSYQFGKNETFFNGFTRIRQVYDQLKGSVQGKQHRWLEGKNEQAEGVGAWMFYDKQNGADLLCVVNTDLENTKNEVLLSNPLDMDDLEMPKADVKALSFKPLFSTASVNPNAVATTVTYKGKLVKITNLAPGEGRIYRINAHKSSTVVSEKPAKGDLLTLKK